MNQQWMCLLLLCGLGLTGCHGGKEAGGSKADSSAKQGGGSDRKSGGSDGKGGGSGKQGGGSTGKSSGSDSKSGGSDSSGTSGAQKDGSVTSDTVKIKPEDQQRAGIQVAAVVVRSMPRVLTVAGQVAMDEKHTDHIGAIADGRIESVYVLPGDRVRKGQTLATLHSHSVHETVGALAQAFAAVRRQDSAVSFAVQARDRYAKLYGIQAASLEEKQRSEQGVAQAQMDRVDAEANVRMEREHLSELLQVRPETLTPETLYRQELIPVRAVADGVVITRNVTPGQVVNTGDETFVTSNLATVWVNASVNDTDLPGVRVGASARVSITGQSAGGQGSSGQSGQNQQPKQLPGRVGMLGDVVDPQTRTLPVRVVVPNPGTTLRPGMFASAAIDEAATRTAIFVPSDALQDVNGFRVVFVTSDGTTFEARAVKTGPELKGMTEIVEGLQPTDHVVVNGAFMVKGELLKGTVGEG